MLHLIVKAIMPKNLLLNKMREPLHRLVNEINIIYWGSQFRYLSLSCKSHISSPTEKKCKFIGMSFRSSFYLSTASVPMLYN